MRSSKTEAIVIRKRNFSEKDRILTLFSRDRGKIDVISKGSRRPGSRFSYFSDIGSIGLFYLYEAKFLPIVTDYKSLFSPEAARGNMDRTEKLSFMYKLVDKLFEKDESHLKTYEVLKEATKNISDSENQLIFLSFLLNVISDLGIKPELHRCIVCRKEIAEKEKTCFSHKGGVCHLLCEAGDMQTIGDDEIKLLRIILEMPYNKISRAQVNSKIFTKTYAVVLSYLEWNFGKILPEKVL